MTITSVGRDNRRRGNFQLLKPATCLRVVQIEAEVFSVDGIQTTVCELTDFFTLAEKRSLLEIVGGDDCCGEVIVKIGYVKEKSHSGEYLLVGRQGALCGNVQRMKGDFYATEHAVVVTVSEDVNVDFAFHMLTLMNLNQYASQSAQPGLAVGKLEGLKMPVPSLVEQVRIAAILDKFDALTNSLTEGLPREIELRKKQYEHYRDLLLSFPKPESVVA